MRTCGLLGLLFATAVSGVFQLAVIDGRTTIGRFGDAVCGLDFNDDGLSDIAIGEPGWNNVYIFLGGTPFDTTPDLMLKGTAGTYYGSCLSAVGDINGDNMDDLAVGAPRDNAGGAGAGRAYFYFGSTTPDTVVDFILTGHVQGGRFGQSIDGASDVNGDSETDILVGAPGDKHAFLFLGGSLLDTLPDLTLRNGSGDYFGGAVALLGDVTTDSFGDMLVGDYRHTGGLLHGGGCFLYHGSDPLDPGLDQQWDGDYENRQLGVTLCAPGDLNGDSINDLAFGGSYTATVDLHWGGGAIGNAPDLRLQGNRRFGSWIHGGIDVNGDRFADLLVGADGDDLGTPTGPGYAYLFLGGNPMSATADTVIEGETDGDMFGSCLAFCGDVNGDRRIEFAVGAPGHDSQGSNSGRVYVYSSSETGIEHHPGTEPAPQPGFQQTIRVNAGAELDCDPDVDRILLVDVTGRIAASLTCRGERNARIPELTPGIYTLLAIPGSGTSRTRLVIVD